MYSFSEILIFFYIYAFLGWCMEVTYAVLDTGKFSNRGFLNGPLCPIYGFGMVTILLLVEPVQENLFLLFVFSMFITTAIEFITGCALEKIFNAKWWDYSDLPFNIKGYICLKFSIYWGFACTFVIKVIHSLIYSLVQITPNLLLIILLIVFSILMLSDSIVTICTIFKLKKRINVMEKLAQEVKEFSDNLGEKISEKVLDAKEKNEEIKDKLEDKLEDWEEKRNEYISEIKNKKKIVGKKTKKDILSYKKKYNELLSKKSIWQDRIINQIKWGNNQQIIEKIKEVGKIRRGQ